MTKDVMRFSCIKQQDGEAFYRASVRVESAYLPEVLEAMLCFLRAAGFSFKLGATLQIIEEEGSPHGKEED